MAGVERGPRKQFPLAVGTVVGELTIIDWVRHTKDTGRSAGWQPFVRCSCGHEGMVDRQNLLKGRTTRCQTCGRAAAQKGAKNYRKHYWGYEDVEPDYAIRTAMLNRIASIVGRCRNRNDKQYERYGGRGITVADEWVNDRASFLRYLKALRGYGDLTLEIDRIDNDRGYMPGNIRFATRKENVANRRTVARLQSIIDALKEENADLRRRLRRAEEQIHDPD